MSRKLEVLGKRHLRLLKQLKKEREQNANKNIKKQHH